MHVCTLCGRETDGGHLCVVSGCKEWIGDCCEADIAMCDEHFKQQRKKAKV